MTAETFSPGTKGITNQVKLIRREQVESTFHGGRAPEVHCYATPIYITLESAVSRTNFCYLNIMKFSFLGFPCCNTREDLSIDVSITNVGLILTKLR